MDNRKQISNLPVLIALVSIMALVSGCSKTSPEIGLWVSDGDEGSIEFKADGQVIVIDNMGLEVTGTYQMEEKDTLLLQLTGSNIFDTQATETKPYSVRAVHEIDGDELTLAIGEERLVYRRH